MDNASLDRTSAIAKMLTPLIMQAAETTEELYLITLKVMMCIISLTVKEASGDVEVIDWFSRSLKEYMEYVRSAMASGKIPTVDQYIAEQERDGQPVN